MLGGIRSSGVKNKSIASIKESLSSLGIGNGEKDSISALEASELNSSGRRGDELSYNNSGRDEFHSHDDNQFHQFPVELI
uniref:Uncharacterized protein n=1 Tax=Tanacetum cinerariifolium TaxID=118510 RepID=A0A699X1Y0_TANCI|nr:hypothetical protein [Tanacetum cinerariifolium]